jgi:hypothetical protein
MPANNAGHSPYSCLDIAGMARSQAYPAFPVLIRSSRPFGPLMSPIRQML